MVRIDDAKLAEKTAERLSVNVSPATALTIRELANAKSTTITEIIRRSVAVLKLLEDEQAQGTELHLVRKNENTVRLLHLI